MPDDFSELYELAADLTSVEGNLGPLVKKAIQYTSMEIKKDWRQGAERTGLSGYAASVDFDIKAGSGVIESEIGPNLAHGQGSFGFVEAGGGGVRSAPQHAGRDALEANEADFYRGLEVAVYDATVKAVGK